MTPSRRLQGHQAYGQAVDAFDAVAWRPPVAQRFDPRVANDVPAARPWVARPSQRAASPLDGVPAWLTVVGGGFAAALVGALLGGMLQV